MLIPVNKNIFRWGTPDPEGDWVMYGHLIIREETCYLIDPPLVPDLLDSVLRIGKLGAVILTTLDHTRGAKYICAKSKADLFIPEQLKSTSVDPDLILSQKGIKDFQKYGTKNLFGMKPIRITIEGKVNGEMPWIDEFALLTDNKELIVGDIAVGTFDGKVIVAPEWFPHNPPNSPYLPAIKAFSEIVPESGAVSLLASHGYNLYDKLQESMHSLFSG
jgi:glyoxylase-like metal-dependent hydrolase (beta-lactamase superfamily II)